MRLPSLKKTLSFKQAYEHLSRLVELRGRSLGDCFCQEHKMRSMHESLIVKRASPDPIFIKMSAKI